MQNHADKWIGRERERNQRCFHSTWSWCLWSHFLTVLSPGTGLLNGPWTGGLTITRELVRNGVSGLAADLLHRNLWGGTRESATWQALQVTLWVTLILERPSCFAFPSGPRSPTPKLQKQWMLKLLGVKMLSWRVEKKRKEKKSQGRKRGKSYSRAINPSPQAHLSHFGI